MAIADEVEARYPEQTLIELTNPRTKGQTSIDSTKLAQAITSAQSLFKTHVQAEYDETNGQHVEVICQLVVCLLQRWGGATGGTARIRWDDWVEQARALSRVGPRGHEGPVSNSTLTPSRPRADSGGVVRPEMDDAIWRDRIPTRLQSGDVEQGG